MMNELLKGQSTKLSIREEFIGFSVLGVYKENYFYGELNPLKECLEVETNYHNKKELMEFITNESKKGIVKGIYNDELTPLYYFAEMNT